MSSYIEWAIEDSLNRTILQEAVDGKTTSLADEVANLWDVDEADRFAKLALRYPELLTHEEQVRWKLIRENGFLWKGGFRSGSGPRKEWAWSVKEHALLFARLRKHWAAFCSVAETGVGQESLPTWTKVEGGHDSSSAREQTGFDDMDDDIPF